MCILLVGGNTGVGADLSKKLTEEGENHIILSREKPDFQGDFSHVALEDFDNLPKLAVALKGVVYLPGSINLKPFKMLTEQDYLDDYQVNFLGAVKVLHAYEKNLLESTAPSVVMFSSIAVQKGFAFHASIAAAKGAVEGFVRSLAVEWAPKVRVNCIAPSLTDTPLASHLFAKEAVVKASESKHPLKRLGTADDLASAAYFLLSSQSSWVTGQILHVDGGLSVS